MDDLISRKALLDAYDKAHQGPPGGARKLIEEAQDAVVRCKDCKYVDYMHGYKKYQCPRNKRFVSEDWYCADGKRKSEDV